MAKQRRSSFNTPGDLIASGVSLAVLAGLVAVAAAAMVSEIAGWVVLGVVGFIAQAVFTVGIIAKGVEVGNRASKG